MGCGRLHAVAGRGTHGLAGCGVLHICIDGSRVRSHLLLAWREGTGGSAVGVTWRAT